MPICPVCQTENSTLVCACGFDISCNYESYPTFGRLPSGLPSIVGLTAVEEEPRPRKAVVKCPECGLEAKIYEDQSRPKCSKCGALLNPADYFDFHNQQLHKYVASDNLKDRLMNAIENSEELSTSAAKALSVVRYASADAVHNLEEALFELSLFTRNSDEIAFILHAIPKVYSEIEAAIKQKDFGHNIFDEWEADNAEIRQMQAEVAKSMGFLVRGDKIRFPAFRAEDYRCHAQNPLFRDAAAAYAKEDYETAAKLYQAAEAEGNPYASAHLGMMHYWGLGCKQDYTAAAECFLQGALNHCPLSAAWFCDCIRLGHGAVKNEDTAERLYAAVYPALRQMCDAGDNDARHFLGFNLLDGICIQKDEAAGIRLLELAHTQGHRRAAVQLASCYYYGEGVERSYDTAFRLLRENQTAGNRRAQFLLGQCYYWGYGTEKNYDQAFAYFKRAAELGHGSAKDYLGDCYRLGRGTDVNFNEAARWYHDAADNHQNVHAAHSLAFQYNNGQGVEKNEKTAVDYWMIAAEGGITQAQRIISEEYLRGAYLEKDNEKARLWMEKAAEKGDAEAQVMLGRYYMSDFGFDDDSKAFSWFMKAAEQGHAQAQCIVGGCCLYSIGTERDPDKGIEYLIRSSDAGHLQASRDLAEWYYLGIEDYKGQKLYKNPTLAHKYAMLAVRNETDGAAQYRLGTIIHHSFGNPAGAIEWYRRAIANGSQEAKLELSKALIQLQENLHEAWKLLQDDEIAPESVSQSTMAEVFYWRSVCLENGWGCSRMKREARRFYNRALELGYVDTAKKKKRFGLF